MRKILKGSVVITEQHTHYWVVEHISGFIKALSEDGKEINISESVAESSEILPGSDAMEIIKKFWY